MGQILKSFHYSYASSSSSDEVDELSNQSGKLFSMVVDGQRGDKVDKLAPPFIDGVVASTFESSLTDEAQLPISFFLLDHGILIINSRGELTCLYETAQCLKTVVRLGMHCRSPSP